jgi:hypothetical protein
LNFTFRLLRHRDSNVIVFVVIDGQLTESTGHCFGALVGCGFKFVE